MEIHIKLDLDKHYVWEN